MIHTFSMNHLNFVVDENSGSIHVVDDVGFDIIRDKQELPCVDDVVKSLCNQYKKADILDAFTEIELLIKEGSLFTPESKLKAAAALKPEHSGIKALCLHVSHDCNLRCEYCFASKGDYQTGRKLMPEDVALKATDYLVEQSGHRHTIEIDFFGGEPLLNFETVKAVVAYGRELEHHTGKRFYFTITTNARRLVASAGQNFFVRVVATPMLGLQMEI
ncbi:MAG TPA: 4Fe-4S cluster-binding domain-containing protein [Candidatus Limiplasma sp.]|nr:4Fe-4S cluster-binding domain-containing protein [Candidatus Limiplasma sp.]